MSGIPSEATIVDWYFAPTHAVRTAKPERAYNDKVTDLADSITLTMQYLAAAAKPFDEGRPRLIKGLNSEQTLFWSIYETRSDDKVVVDGETKTVTTILYYGFDAAGNLTLETVKSKSFEDMYRNRYSWPSATDIPKRHRLKLHQKLKEFRASLVIS